MSELDTAIKNTQELLRETADAVGHLKPDGSKVFSFLISDLADTETRENIIEKISQWEKEHGDSKYLYFYRAEDFDADLAYRLFYETKVVKKEDRAYPRLNNRSNVLYVGSSQNLTLRFKEHLGYGAKGTYAMQLSYWAQKLKMKINFHCFRFQRDIPSEVLQAVEDGLWLLLKPMLGRKGSR